MLGRQGGWECPFDHPAIRSVEYAGDDEFAAIYNIAPILPGHSLIVPRRHVERLALLKDDEVCHLFLFARRVTDFLSAHFQADGFDWTIQDGASAGQTVGHVHLHVVPRRPEDLLSPGGWYMRLRSPIDSEARPRLSNSELNRIVTVLRSAATEAGFR